MKKLFLLLILLAFIIIGACTTKTAPPPIEDKEPETIQNQTQEIEEPEEPQDLMPPRGEKLPELTLTLKQCNIDSQCVRVKADCCGCGAGGKAVAIKKDFENNWISNVRSKCTGVACAAVLSNDWTCFAEVKCIKNKCTLVKSE